MASTRLLLRGAPDASIGTAEAKNNGLQVMQLEMTQEVIDELLESVRSGKPPQILFGRAPQLRYGDKSHVLESSNENLRNELYRQDDDGQFRFTGLINHSLAIRSAEQITAGVDTALETLKNSMATLNQEKEARQAIVESSSMIPHHRRNISSSGRSNHRALLNPNAHMATPNRSLPSSPALGASASPSMGTRPTSALHQDSAKTAAIRKTIIHIIASEPKPAASITRLTRSTPDETKQILDRVASLGTDGYKLLDRAYKELDLWSFPYKNDEERHSAVENAIKAFDRMRMSKDDPLWQKLLPKEERGKGKCLSRLKINAPAQAPAPAPLNLKKTEKKEATAKKAEAKKAAAAEEGEKKAKEKDPIIRKVTKKIDSVMSTMERAKKEPKRQAKKNTTSEPAKASQQKQKKETAKPPSSGLAKSPSKPVTNKPKTPSPLSASPPVNASDFEDDHPVHKALSAAASPTKASTSSSDRPLKYRMERSEKHTAPAKQRKAEQERTPVNGFRPGTSSASSSAEKKRKLADVDHSDRSSTPQKKRQLDLINTAAASHVSHPHSHSQKVDMSTSPSSSSPTSPLLPLTYQQTIALSQKFHIYYEKYYKLHTQLNQSDRPPTKQQRDDLWKMHEMLAKMKEEIRVGAQRQH